jgi:hypothetical protein
MAMLGMNLRIPKKRGLPWTGGSRICGYQRTLGDLGRRWAWPLWVGLLVLCGAGGKIFAEEPATAFLEALRREGLLDLADHYLSQCEKNPAVAAEFQQRIPFEQAKTRFAALRNRAEIRKRIEDLQSIETLLAKYDGPVEVDELPTAPMQLQMDSALLRARLLALRTKQAAQEDERQKLRVEADEAFQAALATLGKLIPKLRGFLEDLEKKPQESQNTELRDQGRKVYMDNQGNVPQIALERALLLPDGTEERKKLLQSASDEFTQLLKKYSSRENYYLQFLLQSARCYALLGDSKEALSRYTEVLEAKGLPAAVTGRATAGLMDLWQKDPNFAAKVIPSGEAWLAANPKESPETLAPVQVALAKGIRERASQESPALAKKSRKKIRDLLATAIQVPGEWGEEARALRAELSSGDEGLVLGTDLDSLVDFDSALLEGQNAIGRMQSAENGKKLLEDQLAIVENPAQRAELEKGFEQANRDIAENRAAAKLYVRRALELIGPDQKEEEISQARFTLGYLFFAEGRLYEAAVLCEHTAKNFPNTPQSRLAARTALASYAKLLEQNPASDFAKRSVLSLSQYCAARWPREEEGKNAILTSLQMLVGMRDFGQAKKYLSQLPEESEVRPEGELAMGAALYREYQIRRSELISSGQPLDPLPDEMITLRTEARGFLESGLAARGAAANSSSSVLAMIALAGVYFDQGEDAKALALIETPDTGLMPLADRNDPAVSRKGFREDIYRLALKARMIAMSKAQGGVDQDTVDNFKRLMKQLADAVGDTPEGKQRLFTIYVSLARELRELVATAPSSSRVAVADSFEVILLQIGTQAEDPQIMHWVAQSLVDLADVFPTKAGTPDLRAKRFLAGAEKILHTVADLPSVKADASLLLQTKLRIASVLRRQQDFRGAIELFAEVLSQRNQLLNVQVEAAQTYQEGNAFDFAIKGGRPDKKSGKNTIWGWESINHILTKAVRNNPDNEEYVRLLHESRIQIATCRLLQGRAAEGERRTELLERAEKVILSIRTFDPTYGGDAWLPKYDQLLREIQSELGKSGHGLQGLSKVRTSKQE